MNIQDLKNSEVVISIEGVEYTMSLANYSDWDELIADAFRDAGIVADGESDDIEYSVERVDGVPESQITWGEGGSIDDAVFTAIEDINNLDDEDKFWEYVDEVESDDVEDIISEGVDHYESRMDDRSYGQYKSWAEFAEQQVDEGLWGEVSDALKRYIDFDDLGSDLEMDYTMTTSGYIFTDNY